jgi:hypothetical protein
MPVANLYIGYYDGPTVQYQPQWPRLQAPLRVASCCAALADSAAWLGHLWLQSPGVSTGVYTRTRGQFPSQALTRRPPSPTRMQSLCTQACHCHYEQADGRHLNHANFEVPVRTLASTASAAEVQGRGWRTLQFKLTRMVSVVESSLSGPSSLRSPRPDQLGRWQWRAARPRGPRRRPGRRRLALSPLGWRKQPGRRCGPGRCLCLGGHPAGGSVRRR